jgi:5-methyltetrahydropteroyltriglutamate--homocysteine methyltransferase
LENTMTTTNSVQSATIGYPRIGRERELKRTLEDFWAGDIDEETLRERCRDLRERRWKTQQEAGIDVIPSNDFSLYDHVLDTARMVGAIPERYSEVGDPTGLEAYFAMARGQQDADLEALEMTKWFDTNYHYIVPELSADQTFEYADDKPVREYREAEELGVDTRPVLLGPVSFLQLAKTTDSETEALDLAEDLADVYAEVLEDLAEAGAEAVQLEEPCLVVDQDETALSSFRSAYERLAAAAGDDLDLWLTTYFGPLRDNLEVAFDLPVDGVHLDMVRGGELDEALETVGDDQSLSLGLVAGRNVWRTDLDAALEPLDRAVDTLGGGRVQVAASTSLMYVPVDLEREERLDDEICSWLAFAEQKLDEIAALATAADGDDQEADEVFDASRRAHASRRDSERIHEPAVADRVDGIDDAMATRDSDFEERRQTQADRLDLPDYPATTIGSFPQRSEVRSKRAAFKKGDIDEEEYESFIGDEIERTVRAQEEIGLDMLVHGESERSDMVEYFGQQLTGFAFTDHGWVQSYGSRCVRPPIIYGDVERPEPMTVDWVSYAAELTDRPMKGMLTGPVTMLQWSFVRDDQPREETARQLALALRDEVADLEESGIPAIQVDEPAIREGLPLREDEWDEYLDWAVETFRLTTAVVDDETQIQTHMCYSDFNDIIESVAALDADALFIEASRSDMQLLEIFESFEYPNDIGPGVYDIHSPRIPSVDEMVELLEKASELIDPDKLWVVPDCGLKTRNWDEVRPSLERMVEAAEQMR